MTPEELDAMTDDELRIKAAELDGWTQCASRGGDGVTGVPSQEWLDRNSDEFGPYGILHYIPEYLDDIETAWGLWARLREEGWYCMVRNGSMGGGKLSRSRETTVLLWHEEHNSINVVEPDDKAAPRAITKAFIWAREPA
ncbi:MAG: hypothetical protein U9Q07_02815 [Planctomycetota bacterium]|nr:hypothetical protein [Planctomycetota bacterium]